MNIAIIGGGFSGLALAWTLLQTNHHLKISLFDAQGIGAGASGIAAGLMHPFSGAHSKLNRWGHEGIKATIQLLEASEKALGKKIYNSKGILRPALLPSQMEEFHSASKKYPDEIEWFSEEKMQNIIPGLGNVPGIFIKEGITVYTKDYLQGLWLSCQGLGAQFIHHQVNSLNELADFDFILVAMGAHCLDLKDLAHLPLTYTKGQILELEWPIGLPSLPIPLNSQIYCVMLSDGKRCLVGSTYERNFSSFASDVNAAKAEILPKLALLYPPLREAKIIDCHAGIRASAPQHLPLLQQVNKRCFVLSGMGSKGLLYHGLFAQRLVKLLFSLPGNIF